MLQLYGEIEAQLDQWRIPGSKLQLASAAPRLLSLRDCLLTVPGKVPISITHSGNKLTLPGQYDHNIKLDDQSFIDSFHSSVDILSSKQLPRKLVIRSYKSDFTFLLKGKFHLCQCKTQN